MQRPPNLHELLAVLAWQRAMGVDAAVAEVATDWTEQGDQAPGAHFEVARGSEPPAVAMPDAPVVRPGPARVPPPAQGARPEAPAYETGQAAPRGPEPAPPDVAVTKARRAAKAASSLIQLGVAIADFDGCPLKATAKNLCFYRGSEKAGLMIIGEAPGRDEDIEGRPFVGRAGQLLDKMLAAIGLTEADVHITNTVYWRPPGNRTPTPQETESCRPFLERQVELVAPDVVLLLGGAAAKHFLDTAQGIMQVRGRWHEQTVGGRSIKILATLHPAYLLRTPAYKKRVWSDLLALKAALEARKSL